MTYLRSNTLYYLVLPLSFSLYSYIFYIFYFESISYHIISTKLWPYSKVWNSLDCTCEIFTFFFGRRLSQVSSKFNSTVLVTCQYWGFLKYILDWLYLTYFVLSMSIELYDLFLCLSFDSLIRKKSRDMLSLSLLLLGVFAVRVGLVLRLKVTRTTR